MTKNKVLIEISDDSYNLSSTVDIEKQITMIRRFYFDWLSKSNEKENKEEDKE